CSRSCFSWSREKKLPTIAGPRSGTTVRTCRLAPLDFASSTAVRIALTSAPAWPRSTGTRILRYIAVPPPLLPGQRIARERAAAPTLRPDHQAEEQQGGDVEDLARHAFGPDFDGGDENRGVGIEIDVRQALAGQAVHVERLFEHDLLAFDMRGHPGC